MKDRPKPAEIPFAPRVPEITPGEETKPIYQPGEDPEIPPEQEPIELPSPKEIPPQKNQRECTRSLDEDKSLLSNKPFALDCRCCKHWICIG